MLNGVSVGSLVIFLSAFCMLGVCHVLHSTVKMGCVVLSLPLVPWKGQGEGIMFLLGLGYRLYSQPRSVAANGLSAFLPRTCWASSVVHCICKGWAGVGVQPRALPWYPVGEHRPENGSRHEANSSHLSSPYRASTETVLHMLSMVAGTRPVRLAGKRWAAVGSGRDGPGAPAHLPSIATALL